MRRGGVASLMKTEGVPAKEPRPDLDVVIVPDFLGRSSQAFEYNTTLFLASWLETGSEKSNCQLHVVCIGEPPEVIRRLGEAARARLTVCDPYPGPDRFRNKLRGLQIEPTAERFLLLDADIVLFRSITEVAKLLAPNAIAAAYGGAALSVAQWRIVYERLGMAPPTRRVAINKAPLAKGFGDPLQSEFAATFPYYNAGVVTAPWASGLAPLWEKLIDEVPRILRSDTRLGPVAQRAFLDQPPLAVALEVLERRGWPLHILPHRLHVRWLDVCSGFVSATDAMVCHNTGLFRRNQELGLVAGVRRYAERTRDRMKTRGGTPGQNARLAAFGDHVEEHLLGLARRWID